eukprot:NODE_607_length_5446_cov_0.832055.p2 type:complete len:334 gc:universal NODE_607_length_5446_cov_0.832055:4841-3840(-)
MKENKLHVVGIACIGQPGSGKSSLCEALNVYFEHTNIPHFLINMDPGNPYESENCAINIREFIMSERIDNLGPNGAILKCMDSICENFQWLSSSIESKIETFHTKESSESVIFVIFDFPGQIELYMHDSSTNKLFQKLEKLLRLVVVSVSDSTYLPDFHHYIAMCLSSLSSMLHIGCPALNVLSKMDMLESERLPGKLREYLFPQDLSLLHNSCTPKIKFFKDFENLTNEICNVIENYGLLNYIPYSIKSPISIQYIVLQILRISGVDFLFEGQNYIQTENEDPVERWEHKIEYDKWENEKLESILDDKQLEEWKSQLNIDTGLIYDSKIIEK